MNYPTSDLTTQFPKTAASIQDWLIDELAARLEMDPDDIDPDAPFESFGLESADALVMLTQLEQWLGQTVPPVLVWNYPTIAQLSQRLVEPPEGDE